MEGISEEGKERVYILDTTLRDGEQSPGFSMKKEEKMRVARMLAALKVDRIEAGFPASSDGDYEAVKSIAQEIKGPEIFGLCVTEKESIDRCWDAVKHSENPGIHTFISTSNIHRKAKLNGISMGDVKKKVKEAVSYAASKTPNVEYSAEDAMRTPIEDLIEVFKIAIDSGAKTINIPDTVGVISPHRYGAAIKEIVDTIKRDMPERMTKDVIFSVHCHDDLGNATANSFSGVVQGGARQVECCINGIGERAGNCALEEIVMNFAIDEAVWGGNFYTGINRKMIYPASRVLVEITGIDVQPNKAIVGNNAFAHEAGIHSKGMIIDPRTYEIMNSKDIGWVEGSQIIMGKHTGKAAVKRRVENLGYEATDAEIIKIRDGIKTLADKKRNIYESDVVWIIEGVVERASQHYKIDYLTYSRNHKEPAHAVVVMNVGGKEKTEIGYGNGSIDAVFQAINKVAKIKSESEMLKYFDVRADTPGRDAIGKAIIGISGENGNGNGILYGTFGDTDIIYAAAHAYVKAINRKINGEKARK